MDHIQGYHNDPLAEKATKFFMMVNIIYPHASGISDSYIDITQVKNGTRHWKCNVPKISTPVQS